MGKNAMHLDHGRSGFVSLIQDLDGMDRIATISELAQKLRAVEISPQDVKPFLCFRKERYQRILLQAAPWYHIILLCWKGGQSSPIHDHIGSNCAVRVVYGVLTETVYERA